MSSNISSTILQRWRELPPTYSFKVDDVSRLKTSTLKSDGSYKCRRFSSGDYQWRLIIYPKGNDKDIGNRFISMYVEIDTTSLISTKQPHEVYADIRFFIFNKKENKYFTIQDVEPKLFNTFRTIWGLPQVLGLDTFDDHKNGYIFGEGHCEFGVDVIVAPSPTKLEALSFGVKIPNPIFSWTVKHLFEIDTPYTSNTFEMGGKNWFLELHASDSNCLSIFLYLANGGDLDEDEKIYVKAIMKIEDSSDHTNGLKKKIRCWFDKSGTGHGYDEILSMGELEDYLDVEDTLTVEVEFKVVSTTKFS